jgi:hypothetical protein
MVLIFVIDNGSLISRMLSVSLVRVRDIDF